MIDVNGTLYFFSGNELWSTKGSANNTKLLKSFNGYQSDFHPTTAGGKLYFVNLDTLWVSNGTSAGTKNIKDPGLAGVEISDLIGSGTTLFVAGYTYKYGTELFAGDISATISTIEASDVQAVKKPMFNATIFPNPVTNTSRLVISGDVQKINITISDVNGKKLWKDAFNDTKQINLPLRQLMPGVYFVRVNNGTESMDIKILK